MNNGRYACLDQTSRLRDHFSPECLRRPNSCLSLHCIALLVLKGKRKVAIYLFLLLIVVIFIILTLLRANFMTATNKITRRYPQVTANYQLSDPLSANSHKNIDNNYNSSNNSNNSNSYIDSSLMTTIDNLCACLYVSSRKWQNPDGEATANSFCPDVDFVLHNPTLCHDAAELEWLVYIISASSNKEERNAVRSTWANEQLFRQPVVKRVFMLGNRAYLIHC